MKMPRLDLESASEFLVRHGEKIVVAVVGLVALLLAWGGIYAMRFEAVSQDHAPEAVDDAVKKARGNIDGKPEPPEDLLPPPRQLADAIDPWRTPLVPWKTGTVPSLSITAAPPVAVLDRPLFEELAKRTKPDVFPIEDLRAVAGLAVLPVAAPADAAGPLEQPAAKPKKPEAGPGRRPPKAGDPLGGGPPPALPPEPQFGPGGPADRGRIVPYVVVTGLIPVEKQAEEYRRRFEACGFRDASRDAPQWCDYEIDRATVGRDGKETWNRIDLAAVAKKRATDWGAAVAVTVDPAFQLAATEDARSKQTTPIGFCSALPQRLDGNWELADLHPWIVERLAVKLAALNAQANPVIPAMGNDMLEPGPGREGPGFDAQEERPPAIVPPEALAERPEYRMFRFVDTAVEPGRTYRYRVRLKVWNPNYAKNPEKMRPHLADPGLAIEPKLASPDSGPSAAATVPDKTRILVGTLRREEFKELRIKPGAGTLEVLVLGPSEQTGSFALRGLVADPGAVVDVDEKYNLKNQRDRARGERIVTRRLLVDAQGRQDDGPAEKEKQPAAIPEPLEVICLQPDGTFEMASLDGSTRLLAEFGRTLSPRATRPDAKAPVPGEVLPGGMPAGLPGDPLARPGARK